MRLKYILRFALILMSCLILVGCWDSSRLEKHNIFSLVIVDYTPKKYTYYIEVANILGSQTQTTQGNYRFTVLKSEGDSLATARDDLNRRNDNPVFLGTTKAVVFTTRMAKQGIEEYINRIRGTVDYRKSVHLFTTSTDPEEIIYDKPENDVSIGAAIDDTINSEASLGGSILISVSNVLQVMDNPAIGFLLPEINIVERENTLTGYSIFRDAKYIGMIPAEDRKGATYFLQKHSKFVYEIPFKDNKFTIEAALSKKKITPSYTKGQAAFKVDMNFKGQVLYMNRMTTLTKQEQKELSNLLKNRIETDILKGLKDSQKTFRCDYLNFYKYFRAKYQSEFKKMNWEEKYPQANMKLTVNAKIVGSLGLEIRSQGE